MPPFDGVVFTWYARHYDHLSPIVELKHISHCFSSMFYCALAWCNSGKNDT